MADAKKCDRCGTLYEINCDKEDRRPSYNGKKVYRFSLLTGIGHEEWYNYDLCPNCACALMSWFCAPRDKED